MLLVLELSSRLLVRAAQARLARTTRWVHDAKGSENKAALIAVEGKAGVLPLLEELFPEEAEKVEGGGKTRERHVPRLVLPTAVGEKRSRIRYVSQGKRFEERRKHGISALDTYVDSKKRRGMEQLSSTGTICDNRKTQG